MIKEYLWEKFMFKFIKALDLRFFNANYISIVALILSIIFIKLMNITEILENSLLENVQLVALFAAFVACFFVKKHKPLFYFIAMVLFLMFTRELNNGRAIFCQYPDNPHEFYTWSHYKYGWLAHIIIGVYMGLVGIYGIVKKIWKNIKEIFDNIKFPFWTFFGCLLCTIAQIIAEEKNNTCIEETSELVLYCLVLAFILIYKKQLNENN